MPTVATLAVTTARAPEHRRTHAATRSERRLAASLKARDPRGLEVVHAEYGPIVFGYVLQRLRDRAAAEDVFQQVMTEVWRRGGEYDVRRASPITWILTIARSRTIDELRRRRPEPVDPHQVPEEPVVDRHDELLDQWRMSHLLAQIPTDERRLLEQRFYGGLSQSEIAERSGLPLGTVKSRMVRGLERLRQLLDAEGIA